MKALAQGIFMPKFQQHPMKTLGEAISNYFHGGQWRADAGQWPKKDTNSSLD